MTNFKKKYFLKKVYKNSTHHFHDRRGLSKELLVKLDLTSSIYTLFHQDNQFQNTSLPSLWGLGCLSA